MKETGQELSRMILRQIVVRQNSTETGMRHEENKKVVYDARYLGR